MREEMRMTIKSRVTNIVLWTAYLTTLAASMGHVAWAFSRLEFEGSQWVGWLAAVSIDLGLASLAYSIQQRRRARRSVRGLWAGVIIFASISAFSNLMHALAAISSGADVSLDIFSELDALALLQAIILSASLPGLVVLLGEIVSADDAQLAEQQERERARIERQAARSAGHDSQSDASMVVLARSGDPLQQARASRKAQAEQAVSALLAFYASNPQATQAQASTAVARSRQWVGATLAQLETKGRINRNGEGVMIVEPVLDEATD
jgi:hypothetical protein